jgi:hypothetical protein
LLGIIKGGGEIAARDEERDTNRLVIDQLVRVSLMMSKAGGGVIIDEKKNVPNLPPPPGLSALAAQ